MSAEDKPVNTVASFKWDSKPPSPVDSQSCGILGRDFLMEIEPCDPESQSLLATSDAQTPAGGASKFAYDPPREPRSMARGGRFPWPAGSASSAHGSTAAHSQQSQFYSTTGGSRPTGGSSRGEGTVCPPDADPFCPPAMPGRTSATAADNPPAFAWQLPDTPRPDPRVERSNSPSHESERADPGVIGSGRPSSYRPEDNNPENLASIGEECM